MWLILIAIFLGCLIKYWYDRRDLPPGPWNLPVLGFLPFLDPLAPHESFTRLSRKFGPIYGFYLGDVYTVVLSDASLIRKVLAMENVTDRPYLYLTNGIMQGYGLVGASGAMWKDQRKFILSSFKHLGITKNSPKRSDIELKISEQVEDFLKYVKSQTRDGVATIDALEPLRHNIGSILNTIVFGRSWPRDDETWRWLQHLQEEGVKHIGVSGPLNFLPFLRFLPKFRSPMEFILDGKIRTHELYKGLIEEQKESIGSQSNLIHLFLRERTLRDGSDVRNFYNDQQFYHLLADVFGAGLDTTLVTLRWLLIFLSLHPNFQQELQKELDRLPEKPLLEEIMDIPLLEAAILETQRIRSVVPLGIPHSNSKELLLEGYRIPKGSMIVPLQWAVHMDGRSWVDPASFDPWRFIDLEGRCVKPDSFLPFQTGKRMCPGDEFAKMMLFLFAANIIQQFELHLESEFDTTGEHGITLNPKPHQMTFKCRK